MAKSHCPVCFSQKTSPYLVSTNIHGRTILSGDRFDLNHCLACQAIFVTGLKVDDDYYKKYYTNDYYDHNINNRIVLKLTQLLAKPYYYFNRLAILSFFRKAKTKISILDVGCGNGYFLSTLPIDRFSCYGVEINKRGRGLSRKRGIKIIGSQLNKIRFDHKFDVTTMWHVLEHIEKPWELMSEVHRLLSPNGILVFQTPNTNSLGFKLGKADWFHLDSPRHLVLYNKKSAEVLCQQTGFEIIKIKNEFYDNTPDLFRSVRNSKFRFLIYPFYPLARMVSAEHLTFFCKPSPKKTSRRYNQKNV